MTSTGHQLMMHAAKLSLPTWAILRSIRLTPVTYQTMAVMTLLAFSMRYTTWVTPVGVAKHIRESLAPGGTLMVVEPLAGDRTEDNLHAIGRRILWRFNAYLPTQLALSGCGLVPGCPSRSKTSYRSIGGCRLLIRANCHYPRPLTLCWKQRPEGTYGAEANSAPTRLAVFRITSNLSSVISSMANFTPLAAPGPLFLYAAIGAYLSTPP